MCGVAGVVGINDRGLLEAMVDLQAHRGPDGRGVEWCDAIGGGVGHRRLAIIDLTDTGRQPMRSQRSGRWITYNGELYNFPQLRRELASLGHHFVSHSDTEVVLAAFDEWGPDCLHRLDGMFAFGILDGATGALFLARDPLGIKPLYFARRGSAIAFASELKALRLTRLVGSALNPEAVASVLQYRWIPDPHCVLADAQRLAPGHYLAWSPAAPCEEPVRYWHPRLEHDGPLASADVFEALDELLRGAVARQMLSDVPVGALLSGGVDSSLVTTLMARAADPATITTFTIAFDSADATYEAVASDDAEFSALVAGRLGTRHEVILIRPDVAELLPRLVWHMDEPVADPAIINTFLISQAARTRGIFVLLTGMGGDEVYGGYDSQRAAYLADRVWRRLPVALRRGVVAPLVTAIPVTGARGSRRLVRMAQRFVRMAEHDRVEAFAAAYQYLTSAEALTVLSPDLRGAATGRLTAEHFAKYFEEARALDYASQMCYADLRLFLPSLNLFYSDRAMMAAGVEGRPPLIDRATVEFVLRLPGRFKMTGLRSKVALRHVARRYVPAAVARRPKASFGAPLRSWFRGGLRGLLEDTLNTRAVRASGVLDADAVARVRREHETGARDHMHLLWSMLTIQLWLRQEAPVRPAEYV